MSQLIYAVEDDESLRELVGYALASEGFEVATFGCAEDMLGACKERLPALIVLDIMLPAMDGMDALKALRTRYSGIAIKVIMLTAKTSEISRVSGLNCGADDYVTKPFSVLELIARVKAHLRQYTTQVDGDCLAVGEIRLNPKTRQAWVGERLLGLTYKEFELLQVLLKNAGEVIEREKLLSEVWGFDYMGESRTIDIHIKNLRQKLGGCGDYVISIRGVGYSLRQKGEQDK